MTSQGDFRVTPDPATLLVDGKLVVSEALVTTSPGSLKPTLEILRARLGVLRLRRRYLGYMTLETGFQRMLRSLVDPTRGAGAFEMPAV